MGKIVVATALITGCAGSTSNDFPYNYTSPVNCAVLYDDYIERYMREGDSAYFHTNNEGYIYVMDFKTEGLHVTLYSHGLEYSRSCEVSEIWKAR